ncbi:hypothetical protein QYE76_002007 [Lolium multiflorum]|uniref:Nitrite/Sulfite reductase ferredoxin-like domain-containing protein n=1 Tax=Lolium multiflorum TaxID=4521 RepID=A0AAD8VXV9_LOLMU|nr:hypothetical protein QYE76_002007 [Lolium multiflorum]
MSAAVSCPMKQEGLSFVGLHVPMGRLQAADMFELARLAYEYGSGNASPWSRTLCSPMSKTRRSTRCSPSC